MVFRGFVLQKFPQMSFETMWIILFKKFNVYLIIFWPRYTIGVYRIYILHFKTVNSLNMYKIYYRSIYDLYSSLKTFNSLNIRLISIFKIYIKAFLVYIIQSNKNPRKAFIQTKPVNNRQWYLFCTTPNP